MAPKLVVHSPIAMIKSGESRIIPALYVFTPISMGRVIIYERLAIPIASLT